MRFSSKIHCFVAPRFTAHCLAVALLCLWTHDVLCAAEPREVRFNRDIRPILSETCWHCHGPGTQKAGLRLDRREAALTATESGALPIVPGKVELSEIIRRVLTTDANELMPPPDSNKKLTAAQKELLKQWVAQGARYEQHWSFEPPVKGDVPQVPGARIHNPIDAFLADRLRRDGLVPLPEADKETLIRRVAFALTGLPPRPQEVDEYLADASPRAYESLVERYLASPRYGEEMARHWLDLARYADTHGLHLDNERQMWAYRDWVIKAFNNNQPFDQFTIEQLAGDLLPNATNDQLVATGFNRCNVTTGEGGSINEEWIYRNAVDRANTAAEVWMGLTAGCAVCHDHKFDPLSTKEYYSLYAFFHSAADPPLDGNALLTAPTVKLTSPDDVQRMAALDAQLAVKQKELDEKSAALAYTDPATVQPPPAVEVIEQLWFDDEFPSGGRVFASPGHPVNFVTAGNGQVLAGTKALKRTDKGLAQDVVEGTPPLAIPAAGKLFAHVWIDPQDAPKALMLQYFKGGWLHRAVWGDYDAINWGAKGTTERVHIGPLPEPGKWARIETDAAKLGINAGDQVTGFALTQFGGTVFWDKVGVAGRSDPAADPRRSFLAWGKQQAGKDTPGVPPDLNNLLKAGLEKAAPDQQKRLRDYYLQAVCLDTKPQIEPLAKVVAALKQERENLDKNIPGSFIFRDLDQPRESFVMLRGQYNKPGEKVEPNVPAILPPLKKAAPERRANRLDFARWLVSPEHPLTARVTVNRFWQQFFGTGLVKTSFDFGSQGELPSHPELLDWLAVTFRDTGWDVKGLARLVVTSAAFRQSAAVGVGVAPGGQPAASDLLSLFKRDPENRLYARGPRFRLDAEQIRDNALFVSGLINLQMGGKGVRPYQPANIWEPVGFAGSNTRNYVQDTGPALYRRSIYTFLKRTAPAPFMANFDAPNRESFCTRRERSNTPLQALQLMNDVQHFESARGLAERMLLEGGATPAERIAFGYRVVLARRPDSSEQAIVEDELRQHLDRFAKDPASAGKLIRVGESKPKPGVPETDLAAYTLIANMLLNLDETVMRN